MNRARGTQDIYFKEAQVFQYVEQIIEIICRQYNLTKVFLPMFEQTAVYTEGIGNASDIVRKEMYNFQDRKNRNLTLRPEGTSGVMRCVVENKLHLKQDLPLKMFYIGDMFRYERPQKDRQRQFLQFGIEIIGTSSPYFDLETILLAIQILSTLKIKNYVLKINNIGNFEERKKFSRKMQDVILPKIDKFCADCKERIKTNPMRILDCKIDQEIMKEVDLPSMLDYLSEDSKRSFAFILNGLKISNVDYVIDNRIVRGLDYYTNCVFEIIYKKTNQAIVAGGRYDYLAEKFEKNLNLPAVGFSFGLERLVSLLDKAEILRQINSEHKIFIHTEEENCLGYASVITYLLRVNGYNVINNYNHKQSLKKYLQKITKQNTTGFLVILKTDLLKDDKNILAIKNLATKKQVEINLNEIINFFQTNISSEV